MHFKISSAICFNLDQSESLSSGNRFKEVPFSRVSITLVHVAVQTARTKRSTQFHETNRHANHKKINGKRGLSPRRNNLHSFSKKMKLFSEGKNDREKGIICQRNYHNFTAFYVYLNGIGKG